MTCLPLRLVAILLCGAIVNVAVAWGCRIFQSGQANEAIRLTTELEERWLRTHDEKSANVVYQLNRLGYRILEVDLADTEWDASEDASKPRRPFVMYGQSVGLPLLCLSGEIWFHSRDWAKKHGKSLAISKPPDEYACVWELGESFLPFRPIWPGFAINTIFYAAILWVVWFGPGAFRRTVRRKRGLCPACAYDLRGRGRGAASQICPECGTALQYRKDRSEL